MTIDDFNYINTNNFYYVIYHLFQSLFKIIQMNIIHQLEII